MGVQVAQGDLVRIPCRRVHDMLCNWLVTDAAITTGTPITAAGAGLRTICKCVRLVYNNL